MSLWRTWKRSSFVLEQLVINPMQVVSSPPSPLFTQTKTTWFENWDKYPSRSQVHLDILQRQNRTNIAVKKKIWKFTEFLLFEIRTVLILLLQSAVSVLHWLVKYYDLAENQTWPESPLASTVCWRCSRPLLMIIYDRNIISHFVDYRLEQRAGFCIHPFIRTRFFFESYACDVVIVIIPVPESFMYIKGYTCIFVWIWVRFCVSV